MADIKSKSERSRNMSAIKNVGTKPEMIVRKYLFERGYRYRKNDNRLPGHPDIVLSKYRSVIFVNGCFWHRHGNCKYAYLPKSNTGFWNEKFLRNVTRDNENYKALKERGWNVIIVWDCELRTKEKISERLQRLEKELIEAIPQMEDFQK